MKQLLKCIELAELLWLNCPAIACCGLKGVGRGGGKKSMFPSRAKLLNEPYNKLGTVTVKLFCFSKSFSHFSEALILFQMVLRKTWKALTGVCCMCVPALEWTDSTAYKTMIWNSVFFWDILAKDNE